MDFKCYKADECTKDDCPHRKDHDCENKGYAMHCLVVHTTVQCLEKEDD